MKHWREYSKLSIIPKLHGIKAHLVRQMLFIDRGIARLIEHWVEQYHQVGRSYDLSYCRAGSLEKQAEVRSKLERRGRHPRVRMNKKRLEDVKKKRQHRHDRQQKRAAVKKEKREKALEEIEVKLENMSAEEANEALADIDVVIDLEEIEQIEDEMSNIT